jgi:hypothetical protein
VASPLLPRSLRVATTCTTERRSSGPPEALRRSGEGMGWVGLGRPMLHMGFRGLRPHRNAARRRPADRLPRGRGASRDLSPTRTTGLTPCRRRWSRPSRLAWRRRPGPGLRGGGPLRPPAQGIRPSARPSRARARPGSRVGAAWLTASRPTRSPVSRWIISLTGPIGAIRDLRSCASAIASRDLRKRRWRLPRRLLVVRSHRLPETWERLHRARERMFAGVPA